jgi:hypothetical protein
MPALSNFHNRRQQSNQKASGIAREDIPHLRAIFITIETASRLASFEVQVLRAFSFAKPTQIALI